MSKLELKESSQTTDDLGEARRLSGVRKESELVCCTLVWLELASHRTNAKRLGRIYHLRFSGGGLRWPVGPESLGALLAVLRLLAALRS